MHTVQSSAPDQSRSDREDCRALTTATWILQIINGWTAELEARCTLFAKQAGALMDWDRRILSNRGVLIKLEVGILSAFSFREAAAMLISLLWFGPG